MSVEVNVLLFHDIGSIAVAKEPKQIDPSRNNAIICYAIGIILSGRVADIEQSEIHEMGYWR